MKQIPGSKASAGNINFTFPGNRRLFSLKRYFLKALVFFSLALLSIISFIHFISVYNSDTNKTDLLVFQKYEIIREVGNIKSSQAEVEGAFRSFLLVQDEDNLRFLHTAQANVLKSVHETILLVKDSLQKQRLSELNKIINRQIFLQGGSATNTAAASAIINNRIYKTEEAEISESTRNLLDAFIKRQNLLLGQLLQASNITKNRALTTAIAGMSFFFFLVTVAFFRLNKDISRRKEASSQLSRSEELTRALLNNTSEGIMVIDRDFKILSINRQSMQDLEMFSGKRPEQGMDFFQFILPAEKEHALENFRKVFAGERVSHEAEYETPLGTKWVRIGHSPVTDGAGNITAVAIIAHDITDTKKGELQIKESERRFRLTMEKLGDNFWEHDCVNNTTNFSKTGYEFLGYKEDGFGNNVNLWWQSIHPDDRPKLVQNDRQYKNGNIDFHSLEYRMICKDNSIKWVLDRGIVTDKDANGKPLKILGTHTDITKLKLAEEKIRESNQAIRAMLESNLEGFYMIDFELRILLINEAGRNHIKIITGKDACKGGSILDFMPPERHLPFKASVEKVKEGYREEKEVKFSTSEGLKWFHNRYFPVYDDKNEIIGLCASTKDITESKLIDNALLKVRAEREESQFRLQSILDNTPLIMFIKDIEGRYLVVNRSFREMTGLQENEIIGKTDFDIDTTERALHYRRADEDVIETLQSFETEETVTGENGTQNLLVVKFPLFDRRNNVYGIGGIATDYTEKVQYRQKLIEAKKAAESAEQLQEQFLANMSHEIRTPMNGIIGMTSILRSTTLSDDQKGFVDIIRQSSDTLLYLINDILDLSKIKSGKLTIEEIPFNLREVFEKSMLPFQLKAKEKNLEIKLVNDMRIPRVLAGDPHRLNQIINNLLSNALKFTAAGYISFTSEIARQTSSKVVVRFIVKDTGIGIPGNKLENIFNSFEQATGATAREFGGTGLGLAITKQLIELQGGEIHASSSVGKGTEFRFEIPYKLVKKQPVPVTEKLLVNDDLSDLTGKRILVAEDNEVNQKVIFHTLKKEGMLSTITNNGKEAIDLLEKGEVFDIIILDLQMPEMDGFQTAIYIRQKLKLTTPIIAVTASALRQERTKCLELGMNEYMTKPFASEELFRQLRKLLAGNIQSYEPEKSPSCNANQYYNLSLLHEMDDNEYTCEVLQLFLDSMPFSLEQIKEEALHENWEPVNKCAHKMKSSFGILQVNEMLELVTNIETRTKEKTGLDKIPGEINKLIELYRLLQPMIENELTTARKTGV